MQKLNRGIAKVRAVPRKPSPGTTRRIFEAASAAIDCLLPDTWRLDTVDRNDSGGMVRVVAADGAAGNASIQVCDRLSTREAAALPNPQSPTIIAAPWLSPRTRELLVKGGLSYIDQTGNAHLSIDRPGLVIRTEGATRNPSPEPRKGPNLRGPRAWALLRTLAEVRPPYGVSELSAALETDPGYISRLLGALSEELLITRQPRQPIRAVEWESVLRQMAITYSLLEANDTTNWLASAGPEQFLADLDAAEQEEWALTGSFAAADLVSVTAPTVAFVYCEDPEGVAEVTRLRQVRTGGNVILARPYSRIVFERTWRRADPVNASLAQVVVDCLTGPGRMPSEGEALLDWMRSNAPRWQAPSLTIRSDIP